MVATSTVMDEHAQRLAVLLERLTPILGLLAERTRRREVTVGRWAAWRVALTDQPASLAGANLDRTSLMIRNTGGADMTVAPTSGALGIGWTVAAGGTLNLDTTAEVHARCADGQTTTLEVLAEYVTVKVAREVDVPPLDVVGEWSA